MKARNGPILDGAIIGVMKAAGLAVGHEIPQPEKPRAGNAVHYAFGAFLGAVYGAAATVAPQVTSGFGLPYGLAVALVVRCGAGECAARAGACLKLAPTEQFASERNAKDALDGLGILLSDPVTACWNGDHGHAFHGNSIRLIEQDRPTAEAAQE